MTAIGKQLCRLWVSKRPSLVTITLPGNDRLCEESGHHPSMHGQSLQLIADVSYGREADH